MSKIEKLISRFRSIPSDFSFKELNTILEHYGFERLKTNAGSHMKWRNKKKLITYMAPRKNPMKQIYLKQLLELLNLYFN